MKIGRLFIKILPKEVKQTEPYVHKEIEPDLTSIFNHLDMSQKFHDERDTVYDLLFESYIICKDYDINY